jgi:hypothetical protein
VQNGNKVKKVLSRVDGNEDILLCCKHKMWCGIQYLMTSTAAKIRENNK